MKTLHQKLIALWLCASAAPAFAEFEWRDTEGEHLELHHDASSVARYVYEPIDESSTERRDETYKPFCHVYRPGSEEALLTKGSGGKFTHHRGIFYGFSKIRYTAEDGKRHENVDTWHCRRAHQVHREFLQREAGPDSAHFTARIDWVGHDGETFATEERTMRFSLEDGDVVIDFESELTPTVPELTLDGDPQHAGVQFRAHDDVAAKTSESTYYIRPETGIAKPGKTINWSGRNDNERTRDLPWKGMCVKLDDQRYTVFYFDHPDNPKPARYSERSYGRFGSYFVAQAAPDDPVSARYRFVVRRGEVDEDEIDSMVDAHTFY